MRLPSSLRGIAPRSIADFATVVAAIVALVATTQIWTVRYFDQQRGMYSVAGVVTIAGAGAIIALTGLSRRRAAG